MSLILSEELEASPVEDQKLQQKDRKGVKGKEKKKNYKIEKPKDVGHFLVQKILISEHARAKML